MELSAAWHTLSTALVPPAALGLVSGDRCPRPGPGQARPADPGCSGLGSSPAGPLRLWVRGAGWELLGPGEKGPELREERPGLPEERPELREERPELPGPGGNGRS